MSSTSHRSIPVINDVPDCEGRISPRHSTEIEAKLCLLGHEHDCVIQNISIHGMTIALEGVDFCVGVQVLVSCEMAPTLCGTIRWISQGTYGVQFVTPLALGQVYQMRDLVPLGKQPRIGRARIRLPANVYFSDQTRSAEVQNLSVGGLMMVLGMPPKPGQRLMIELPNMLPLGAHVRWSGRGRCGIMFSRLLPIATCEELAVHCRLPESWLEEARLSLQKATVG